MMRLSKVTSHHRVTQEQLVSQAHLVCQERGETGETGVILVMTDSPEQQ